MIGRDYYSFLNSQKQTVGELLSNKSSLFYNTLKPISLQELLDFKDEDGKTNFDSINDAFIGDEETGVSFNLIIKVGVKLVCPKSRANKTQFFPEGKITSRYYSDLAFKSSFLYRIENDIKYKTSYNSKQYSLTKFTSLQSVWIWCRRLGDSHLSGSLINLTPFIAGLETNVGKNGGNFSFKLPPINCIYNKSTQKWEIDRKSTIFYMDRNNLNFFSSNHINLEQNSKYNENNKVNSIYFHNLISPNDIVFIKFEKLDSEISERDSLRVSEEDLPNQLYDMIGLVDNNPLSQDVDGKTSISVTGRDLTKVLIEDGTYFFPQEFSQGYYDNLRYSTGSLTQLAKPINRTIEQILSYSLSNLSQILICNEELFRDFKLTTDRLGIWRIIELNIDENVKNRRVIDSSISSLQGSILNFFRKVCYEPFVEFMSDTYGDRFIFSVRTPPFSRLLLQNIINGLYKDESGKEIILDTPFIEVERNQIKSLSLSFSDEFYTWFQVIPKENIGGLIKDMSFITIPPKIFPELVDIYGSKPLQIRHNYLSFNLDLDLENKSNSLSIKEQCLEDLKFIIESNIYLPFSRKGTITLIGDRRLKRGNFFHLLSTNEIFYIDSVRQTYSSDNQRLTILQVSRGLVLDYILGKRVENYGFVSYFDIVSLEGVNVYEDYIEEVVKEEIVLEEEIVPIDGNLSFNFKKKAGVDISKTNPILLEYLNSLPEIFKRKIFITSGNDSKHVNGSKHYSNNALDLRYFPDLHNYIEYDRNGERTRLGIRVLTPNHTSGGISTGIHTHIEMLSTVKSRNRKKIEETKKSEVTKSPTTYKVLNVKKTLDNIKINKKVFQFFIKNLQFGE